MTGFVLFKNKKNYFFEKRRGFCFFARVKPAELRRRRLMIKNSLQ